MNHRFTPSRWQQWRAKLLALAVLSAVIMVIYPALVTHSSRPAQLSAYDDDWNDLSLFVADIEARGHTLKSLVSSPIILNEMVKAEKNGTLLVILGVEKEYSEMEGGALNDYLKAGGNILLADDFGYGNSALAGISNVGTGFYGEPLYDQNHWNEPKHPHNASYAIIDADIPSLGFGGQLLLSAPTAFIAVKPGSKSQELARSSIDSFVDKDGDGEGGPAEVANKTVGGVPVVVELQEGGGRLIMVSDPSLFINEMYGELNNRDFALAVLDYLTGGRKTTVIFEESRHVQSDFISHLYIQLFGYVIYASSNMVAKVLFLAGIILALEFALMRVSNPEPWRHSFNLHRGRTSRYRVPHAHYVHPDTIREVFLEQVRISYGLSLDDFAALPRSRLESFLKDQVLVDFIINKDKRITREQVMQAIGRWKK